MIKFLGYIDDDNTRAQDGKRRIMIGCEEGDVLPVSEGVDFNGGKTEIPDDWSFAIVKGGNAKVLTNGTWGDL